MEKQTLYDAYYDVVWIIPIRSIIVPQPTAQRKQELRRIKDPHHFGHPPQDLLSPYAASRPAFGFVKKSESAWFVWRSDLSPIEMQFFGGSEISPSPPAPTASGNNAHILYIFNRNGVCLLYREWNRPLKTLSSHEDHKLMFGLLFSLKSLTAKLDPTSVEKGNLGIPQLPGQGCSFHSFRTNTYKLSFMESPSGIKIILVTHPRTGDLRESLKYIYNLYVEYVVKNPLYSPGSPIRSELFNTTIDQYVRGIG